MTQSRLASAQTAIAELQARASNVYAKKLLTAGGTAPTCADVNASVDSALGDFTAIVNACVDSKMTFDVTAVKGTPITSVSGS